MRRSRARAASVVALLLGLCVLLAAASASAQAATWNEAPGSELEVAVVTIGPGPVYWQRFGHNAIAIRNRASGEAALYNYGIFDFEAENFLLNFARGRMTYLVVREELRDLGKYLHDGRAIDVQYLNLSPAQRMALRDFLETNVRPENAAYRYEYFESNCSTKVRDAIDGVLGGALSNALSGRSRGYTFRMHTQRLTAPEWWLYLGTHAGLSAHVDRPISFWGESFVPMELARHLPDVQVTDDAGAPVSLVARTERLAEQTGNHALLAPPQWRLRFLAAGLGFAGLLMMLQAMRRAFVARLAFSVLATLFWLVMAIGGIALAALWGFTEHRAAWANHNLLLFDPLTLLLLPTALGALRAHWHPGGLSRAVAGAVALIATIALLFKLLPIPSQDNLDWVALLLPAHLALAYAVRRAPAR